MTQATDLALAINAFVVGCKQDRIWDPIKACCIMAGWSNLTGALYPIKGPAPTNNGFVSGDYNRKTGLVGDGSSKHLGSGRLDNADPRDSHHMSVYVSSLTTNRAPDFYIGVGDVPNSGSSLGRFTTPDHYGRSRFEGLDSLTASTGFFGVNRGSSASYVPRNGGSEVTTSGSSVAASARQIAVFARNYNPVVGNYSNGRLAFYSIGESLNLAALDTRVTTLIQAFAAVIP